MRSRELGNIWPLISVVFIAFLVLVILPLLLQRQRTSRMATVEANVSIGDGGDRSEDAISTPTHRWPDSEVPHTPER